MKFHIEVDMDKTNTITKAVVHSELTGTKLIQLKKGKISNPRGESWLVFCDEGRRKMIVLSQLDF